MASKPIDNLFDSMGKTLFGPRYHPNAVFIVVAVVLFCACWLITGWILFFFAFICREPKPKGRLNDLESGRSKRSKRSRRSAKSRRSGRSSRRSGAPRKSSRVKESTDDES
ncbi:unnamed protein product [Bursaphelenchus okinawaensis]|uniref:Uncharacterized protein n=1 Tax=Bursaphelenchus okinawaensis TaxID=465554 RepID=A0A811LD71_9BILA|nr:unnamed protein product [Bursaphelenchus okinawaensis]CAG9121753.1 unnamed protein product [Bursaphelenchus okinawaensis]